MSDELKDIFVTQPMLPSLDHVMPMLEDIWSRKYVTNFGHYHNLLEKQLSELLDAPHFSLFSNGTLALLIALKALGLKGEVIVTPFTFPATVTCLEWAGLTPVFCDIDKNSLCIAPDKIEGLITEETSAILGVHVYGIPCDVLKIQQIANRYELKVVYDGAHAFMSTVNGTPISDFGDATMFSLHATKLFNTIEGGGVAFKDPEVKAIADKMKNFGLNQGLPEITGINAKMNELQAAVGIANLDILGAERQNRQKLKVEYDKLFKNIKGIRTFSDIMSESLQYYPILVNPEKLGYDRDRLDSIFREENIFTRKYFSPLCSEYPYMKNIAKSASQDMPVAQKVVRDILCMPFYGELLEDGFERIKAIVQKLKK